MDQSTIKDDIFARVQKTAAEAFEISADDILLESSMENIEGWDSLGHLKFIMSLETEFNITFSTDQVPTLTNIKIIYDIINQNLS